MTDKAAKINPLLLETEKEKQDFLEAQERTSTRKKRAATSLSLMSPNHDEIQMMHK